MTARQENWMIEEVGVGSRDVGRPVLWFTVSNGAAGAALQVFDIDEGIARDLLSAVSDVRQLNGRMCRVELDGPRVSFLRLLKAARA